MSNMSLRLPPPRRQIPVFGFTQVIRRLVLVGCGGTGARLAALLARMLPPTIDHVSFIDPDRVEARNLFRQHFTANDVGEYKAEVVAQRFRLGLPPDLHPILQPITTAYEPHALQWLTRGSMVISCVDNMAARRIIYRSVPNIWIDAGNDMHHGQVILSARKAMIQLDRSLVTLPLGRHIGLFDDFHRVSPAGDGPTREKILQDWQHAATNGQAQSFPLWYDGMMRHAPELLGTRPQVRHKALDTPEAEACGHRLDTQTVGVNNMAAAVAANMFETVVTGAPFVYPYVFFSIAPIGLQGVPWPAWGHRRPYVWLSNEGPVLSQHWFETIGRDTIFRTYRPVEVRERIDHNRLIRRRRAARVKAVKQRQDDWTLSSYADFAATSNSSTNRGNR